MARWYVVRAMVEWSGVRYLHWVNKIAQHIVVPLICFVAMGCDVQRPDELSKAEIAESLDGIQAGEERKVGEGLAMKMHRVQATQPLGDGWHKAASTEGGFEVALPLPFNDLRTHSRSKDDVDVRSHTVGAKTPGLLAWSATCVVRRDGKPGPNASAPGSDTRTVSGTPPKAHSRTIHDKDMSCVLVVEAQGTDPLPPQAHIDRFLSSFVRTSKPSW